MALLQVNTFSQALSRIITFHIILPNDAPPEMLAGNSNYDRPMKTLYLLHGFSGSTQDWLTGSLIQELALKYNLAVVMPAGENSFYLNGKGTGRGYETFTAVELPAYCQKTFGLSDKPEDNFIGGLSMAGSSPLFSAFLSRDIPDCFRSHPIYPDHRKSVYSNHNLQYRCGFPASSL